MKRIVKLHTGATKITEDATHKIMTIQEWRGEGERRLGRDYMNWKLKYPMYGRIASTRDFKEAGAKGSSCARQECLERCTEKRASRAGDASGCNRAAYGFFDIPGGKEIIVLDEKGIGAERFASAGQKV